MLKDYFAAFRRNFGQVIFLFVIILLAGAFTLLSHTALIDVMTEISKDAGLSKRDYMALLHSQGYYLFRGLILIQGGILIASFTHVFLRLNIQKYAAQKTVVEDNAKIVNLQNALLTTVANLVEDRDNTTGAHIERTVYVVGCMIEELMKIPKYKVEMSDWNLNIVALSTQLHDVGKIAISDLILNKPAKLTEEEFSKMKEHVNYGLGILNKIGTMTDENDFLRHAQYFVGTHHEKWDGTGYPGGLSGNNIPLQGRIMAVADVYDALVSSRPYKDPMTHEAAMEIITSLSGKHFDPIMVDIFVKIADNAEAQYEVWGLEKQAKETKSK
jgi:putative two-component system response regulator